MSLLMPGILFLNIPGAIQKSGIGKEAACICVRQSRRSINRFPNHERYSVTVTRTNRKYKDYRKTR